MTTIVEDDRLLCNACKGAARWAVVVGAVQSGACGHHLDHELLRLLSEHTLANGTSAGTPGCLVMSVGIGDNRSA